MRSIILDTNVLISGIFWSGPPALILHAWKNQKLNLIFSPEIFEEYTRVSKIIGEKHPEINFLPIIDLIAVHGKMCLPVTLNNPVSQDPDDDKFIACALGAHCKIIVSGDKDLLLVSGYADIEVLKPAAFVNKYL